MNQTQTLEEHLTALHDKLNAAAKTGDEEAKKSINEALQHLDAAQEQLKTRAGGCTEEIGAHLDTLRYHAEKTASDHGESLRDRLHKMMEACKNAIEKCIEEQTMTP